MQQQYQSPNLNQMRTRSFEDDVMNVKTQSLYARLKRLFSTDVIVRNVGGKQLKIKDTDSIMYATDRNSLRDRFNRIRSTAYNAYTRDFSLSYQAARMDLFRDYDCIGPDTIIPLPDGSKPTIKELSEKYKNSPQERFWVFSYDQETKSIKLGRAYHPRKKKGKRLGYKVTFDNGQHIIGSLKHPFYMRDGSVKRLFELRVGDSILPFYQREYGYNKHGFKRYRRLYNFSNGWQTEHKIIAEQFNGKLKRGEVVHHSDFNGSNNNPENLCIMDWKEHKKFHSDYNKNVLWGPENYDIQCEKLKTHPNYINRKFHGWNGRRGNKNPFYGKPHTTESNQKRSVTLKRILKDQDREAEKNPNYRSDITLDNVQEKAFEYYKEYSKINLNDFIKHIGCNHSTLTRRLKKEGINWKFFKRNVETTLNHKIISIECVGEIDVYDVTVEKYANFATDSCIVGNTMDLDPIICSALDIYADECLTTNEVGNMITVHSNNNNVKRILENLFDEILNARFNLWSWVRNMCKYGDFYLKLYITPEYGIYMVEPISAYNVERIENSDPYNKRYVKFQIRPTDTAQAEVLENYQIAHFRLISDSNFLPYGKSIIEGSRRVWKQLSLMEDAMLIHRIMRAPEKRVFYTDTGNLPPNEIDTHVQNLMNKMKKVPYIDENTGDYNLRFNLQNMVEDYYIPVRGGDSGTKIDTLGGMEWTGTEDIEYLRNKLMASLKIPKAFLGYDETVSGKATLASEDVRFARTIQRLQRIITSELTKIAIIHLYAQGYRDESLVDFELELTNPSTIFEKEKIEIWSDKVSVATDMIENKFFSYNWAYKNIFNMSEDDIKVIREEIVEDAKQRFRFDSIENDGDDPAKPFSKIEGSGGGGGGGSGGGGGGLGGLGGLSDTDDLEKLADAEGPEDLDIGDEGEGEEEGPDKESPLKEYSDPQENRDQSGLKKAEEYAFGEDPLGEHERDPEEKKSSERKRSSPISHNFEKSPLHRLEERSKPIVDKEMIGNLSKFLSKTQKETKSELLVETKKSSPTGSKSMLDESNIIE